MIFFFFFPRLSPQQHELELERVEAAHLAQLERTANFWKAEAEAEHAEGLEAALNREERERELEEHRSQLAAKDKELARLRSDLDVSRAAAESVAASFKV